MTPIECFSHDGGGLLTEVRSRLFVTQEPKWQKRNNKNLAKSNPNCNTCGEVSLRAHSVLLLEINE